MSASLLSRRKLLKGCGAALGAGMAFRGPCALANDVRIGSPAPAATLATLDGRRISTADLLGNVVILTFWATWCEPCREELPLLSRYLDEHADSGLRVLGFSLDTEGDCHAASQEPSGALAVQSCPQATD
jgi:cytochrome c biogenesis protein CcmG, thiol:disulfide interchange protein DsbE